MYILSRFKVRSYRNESFLDTLYDITTSLLVLAIVLTDFSFIIILPIQNDTLVRMNLRTSQI